MRKKETFKGKEMGIEEGGGVKDLRAILNFTNIMPTADEMAG